MYNRYIGNTGKYYRVEDVEDYGRPPAREPPRRRDQRRDDRRDERRDDRRDERRDDRRDERRDDRRDERRDDRRAPAPEKRERRNTEAFFGSLPKFSENIRHTIKSNMPAGIDIGDILLVLVLLFLFLEGEDDEMLIILAILAAIWVLPLFGGKGDKK